MLKTGLCGNSVTSRTLSVALCYLPRHSNSSRRVKAQAAQIHRSLVQKFASSQRTTRSRYLQSVVITVHTSTSSVVAHRGSSLFMARTQKKRSYSYDEDSDEDEYGYQDTKADSDSDYDPESEKPQAVSLRCFQVVNRRTLG